MLHRRLQTSCGVCPAGGLAIPKRLESLTGLRRTCLRFASPLEVSKVLGPGALAGTYSKCPSSTMVDIRTLDQNAESSDDGLTPPAAYHSSRVSLMAPR